MQQPCPVHTLTMANVALPGYLHKVRDIICGAINSSWPGTPLSWSPPWSYSWAFVCVGCGVWGVGGIYQLVPYFLFFSLLQTTNRSLLLMRWTCSFPFLYPHFGWSWSHPAHLSWSISKSLAVQTQTCYHRPRLSRVFPWLQWLLHLWARHPTLVKPRRTPPCYCPERLSLPWMVQCESDSLAATAAPCHHLRLPQALWKLWKQIKTENGGSFRDKAEPLV